MTLANSGKRVVVTGMGCVSPLGLNLQSTWQAIAQGQSGAAPIKQFDTSNVDVKFACELKNYDPLQHFDKKELRRLDRFLQLGLMASKEAIHQANLKEGTFDPKRVGVILSSGMGGLTTIEEQHTTGLQRPDRVSPFFIPSTIINMLSGQVSIRYGFQGPNLSIVTACSSSAHAIGEAARLIERGDSDIVIAGGSEAAICMMAMAGFGNMKALSKRNDAPEKASRPFDKDRDGFVMGEGAAVMVLESFEIAQKRGAPILAELAGYARNADAFHETNPSEGGVGAAECMEQALIDSGLSKKDIHYINTHGTSTPAGDVAESQAVIKVFAEEAYKINCNSTKSMTGHLLGAAGALEAVITAMVIQENLCPPTINLDNQDERCPLNYTPHKAVQREVFAALSNSFGFGGTNATLVFKKYK